MTFIDKFNALKKKYGKVDESKISESFAIQIEMTDEDCGGIFYVAYMNGVFAVEPYDYHDRTAAITVSSKVLESILSCKTDPMDAFFAGKLAVDGNVGHALLLVELMKKEPVKRAPRKKAEAPAEDNKTAAKKAPAEKKTAKKTTKKAEK
ncbi:MAG: SCP2 sterol-binding domain-containing protein [Clostridia bacterium]|nr:SCP2 sterol-binding domain-containing protein [Clostridia bacterium]